MSNSLSSASNPKHPRPGSVEHAAFEDTRDLAVKYGLPREVKFCAHCVMSNQRPNSEIEFTHTRQTKKKTIGFDENSVCDACRFAEQKRAGIDWLERDRQLIELCNRYRRDDGRFDCIVPGSGGKDSFYASHMLKYRYGMHPLTVTWAPHIYTEWGWKNFQAWVHAGFDNLCYTPNGRVHRLLTRLAVENILHPFQPFILGQKSLAAKLAILYDVPLVFYGENEAEYGNPRSDTQTSKRSASYHALESLSNVALGGVSLTELTEDYGVEKADLDCYLPADAELVAKKEIEVHYLGYYLKWHPQACFYYAVEHGGFQPSPERTAGTYSKYNSIDDRIDDIHYYTTYIKFGIGRATYDAAQEIRSGEITREEGVALVKKFDGEYPARFESDIFRYLSLPEREFPVAARQFEQPMMDRDYWSDLVDHFRSPHLWQRCSGDWRLRHTVWES